jgi:hypothetical protein
MFYGSIALVFTMLAMSQSYYFGLSLGVSEEGAVSMARWLCLIDLCTAALPIAAVAMLRMEHRWLAGGLLVLTLVYMAFSMTSQIGFAAAERLARSEKNKAITAATAKAQADKNTLISKQIGWNNSVSLNRGVMRSSRQESIASTERLIASAGTIDSGKVYAIPEDAQAQALATLSQKSIGFVQILLVVWAAVLAILAKPIFWALATFFWPRRQNSQATAADGRNTDRGGVSGAKKSPLSPYQSDADVVVPTRTNSPTAQNRSTIGNSPVAENGPVAQVPQQTHGPGARNSPEKGSVSVIQYCGGSSAPWIQQSRRQHRVSKAAAFAELENMIADGKRVPTQMYLANLWGRSKQTVSYWLDGWEKRGLISREWCGKSRAVSGVVG